MRATRRRLPGGLLAALVVVALIGIAPGAPRAVEPSLGDTVIQTGLQRPWDIAFAPDGRMFVSERPGRVVIFASAAPGAQRLNTVPIDGVHAAGEAGAMGMVLDPAFATNRFLYLCVSRDDELEWRNQVIRYVVSGNNLVFDGYVIRTGMRAASIHDGCRVRFGPEGKLWVTMGDASDPPVAQDPQSLNGKVLRVNPDGTIPPDNPVWPGNAGPSAVYTIGHRNPQGIAFSPADGQPFNMEHSHHRVSPTEYEHDTINALYAGANFGWPEVAGPGSGFDQPAWGSGPGRTMAISGGAFVSGPAWGDWSGHLFVGAMSGGALLHFSVSGNTVTELEPYLMGAYGRLRSPVFGPDSSLYVTTDEGNDVIVRVTPSLLRRP